DFGPQCVARRTSEGIVMIRQGRQSDFPPPLSVGSGFPQDSSGKVIPMPTGLDDDEQAAGAQARRGGRLPPVPLFLAVQRAPCFLVVLDRVVNDQEMGTLAGDRAPDAGGRHAAFPAFNVPAMNGSRAA